MERKGCEKIGDVGDKDILVCEKTEKKVIFKNLEWIENELGYFVSKVSAKKEDFLNEKVWKAFVKGEHSWDWHYNCSERRWGYGSDGMDWENENQEWLDCSEMEDISYKNGMSEITIKKEVLEQ